MGAEDNEPTEMTASIRNPSFEDGLNGWEAIGFQKQTNNSPSDEGWNKDGTVYAEKWVSSSWTLPDVIIPNRYRIAARELYGEGVCPCREPIGEP